MIYLFENTWGWLLAALILGLIVGWLTWSDARRDGWLAGWAKWGAVLFVVGAVIALLRLFPGRWGLWVETALLFTTAYIVGCFLGGWLRAALGLEAAKPVAAVATAVAAGPASVEIFGIDTSESYPGVRPAALLGPNGNADDLKAIREIGPLNEKFCNDIGVYHYAQIADWTPANATWVDHHLGQSGLVEREKWIEQAKALVAGKAGAVAAAPAAHGVALADADAAARAAAAAKAEADRAAAVRAAADKAEAEGKAAAASAAALAATAAAKADADRAEAARQATLKAEAERAEAARLAAAKAEADRAAAAKADADRAEAARLAALKAEAERAEAARLAAAKAEADRAAAAKADADRAAAAKAEADRAAAAHPGVRPTAMALADGTARDDLKLIKGIGPKNEKICNDLGVYRFSQIANWTPENATWTGHHMAFPGRIEREHWIPQARLLAAGVDTDHSAAVKSGRIKIDDSSDAPLSAADADALQQGLPQVAAVVEGEASHGGSRPLGLAGPRGGKPDDLKRIKGIGKQNEARLHGLGIWHFDQIAKWTEDNVKWAGSYLAFPGRIDREKWISQAVDLAAGRDTEFSKRVAAGLVPTSADDGTLGQANKEVVPPKG